MTPARILILGSKPGATIPAVDRIYCANAAIAYYRDELSTHLDVINVAAGGALAVQRGTKPSDKAHHNKQKYEMVLAERPNRLIVINNTSACRRLKDDGYEPPITHLSYPERRRIIRAITGMTDPVKPLNLSGIPLQHRIMYFRNLFRAGLQRALNKDVKCKSAFRPSTGIFSLIYAISENGPAAEYVISGIGLMDRHKYLNTEFVKGQKMKPHLYADERLLQLLSRRYHIVTTETELMDILPPMSDVSATPS